MIGRLLCRLGLHRWQFADACDHGDEDFPTSIVTYCWCKRPACDFPTSIVSIEHRVPFKAIK